jgi:hypothetical protein
MSVSTLTAPTAPEGDRVSGSLDPSRQQLWRAVRGPAFVALAVLATALILAVVGGSGRTGYLDPRAVDPAGSRAVAEVLRDQGVRVELVTTEAALRATARPGDTVLVVFPERVLGPRARRVAETGADLVVVGTGQPHDFVPEVRSTGYAKPGARPADCRLPAALRAGSADTGGRSYAFDGDAPVASCYPAGGEATVIQVQLPGHTATFLGNPEPLTNERFDDLGNAALVLGLLGGNDRLLWYLPSFNDLPAGEAQSFYDLVPDGIWWGLAQGLVALLILMLWRARRLGPVVPESLPVVVRAAETVEGQARLYRRAGARDRAAALLRAGALGRLLPLLRLPRGAAPPAVSDAVAARTRRSSAEIAALLYGAAPADDTALVRLANDLDALNREIRQP